MSEKSENKTAASPTLHHLNLKTVHLQAMVDWYGTVLGMHTIFQFPGGAWLTNDGANHRLALLTSPQLSDDPDKLIHTGIHHSAFEYASIDELLATYMRLKGLGIEPHACLDHGMTTSLYYVDPDGNSLELQVDNFGNWAESSEWMGSAPQFAANPIGMPFDPAQMASARQAGASFAKLHQRAYSGEFKPQGPLDLRLPMGDAPAAK